ncbi:DDE-type integrase/transposase/recombinase [bacterium]|nr:DDE-type integrase/transposase/recombinase [bacterium]MBU1434352.1 DDE-type integrase/transposase/recombinase [bacterium]MBU1503743.1 DDE-type integrase/transposase/recombinase [bacterium]
MAVIQFKIGTNIFYNEEEYQIKGYPSLDEVLIKLTKKPFNEKVVKVSTLIKEPRNAHEQSKELVDISDKDFEKALEKYKIIEPLLTLEKRTAKDVQAVAKTHKRGIATIYRWLTTYETFNTVSSLSSVYKNCGAKGKSRLDKSVEAIIESVIDEFYLTKQQYPLSIIYMKIVEKCNNLNLEIPNKNTIRNRINTLNPKIVAKNRKGVSVKDTRGMPGQYPEVKMPLDVIQIDHTKVDVILVDEETREEIGRPYITVAIDVYSRMVYGFYISLEAPSYFSVGQALLNAILPKDDLLKMYNVAGEWPVFGLPRAVSMDNAKEFRSISLQKFCSEYRIKDIYRPVARSHFGGIIERLVGISMKKTHLIPGTTFSSIGKKGTYDSAKNAVMTISELEQWYTDFIINIYHKTVHGTIHMTPEEKLYQGILGVGDGSIPFLPTVPSDTLKLRMALLPASERTVQKNGITIDYITYFSETLRKWIIPAEYKKLNKNLKSNNVLCRRDPRDISKIYLYDSDIDNYIEIPYADIRRPAMNIKELRKSIAAAKKEVTGRELEQHDIFQAYNRLFEYSEKAKREQKTVRRQKSSKKHMQKTMDYESKILQGDINLNVNNKKLIEDDEDGYEYYPVG